MSHSRTTRLCNVNKTPGKCPRHRIIITESRLPTLRLHALCLKRENRETFFIEPRQHLSISLFVVKQRFPLGRLSPFCCKPGTFHAVNSCTEVKCQSTMLSCFCLISQKNFQHALRVVEKPFNNNHPLQRKDEAKYLASRLRNKLPRFVVDRAVRITFRRRIASF